MSTAHRRGSSAQSAPWILPVLGACVLIGVAAFAYGLISDPLRAWQSIHVNFLYWLGLTFASVVISAIYELTASKWGQHVKRLNESVVALIPMVLIAYLGVMAGHETIYHAAHEEFRHHGHELTGGKALWLRTDFLLARDGIVLLLFSFVAIWFIKHALRPALGVAAASRAALRRSPLAQWIIGGYRGYAIERARSTRTRQILAPILVLLYALTMTIIAFDQIMGLDPIWISTLFGAYFFITSLYLAWAALSAASVVARLRRGTDSIARTGRRIVVDDFHSLGKLLFAFCMLSADFFWSQYVVIWYGNIPEETPFILRRVRMEPWSDVSWAVLLFCYAVPFIWLIFKRNKRTPESLFAISVLIMVMVWIERFLLVVPSLWHHPHGLPLGLVEIGVTLGFVGLAGICYRYVVTIFAEAIPERLLDGDGQQGEVGHG